MFRLISLYQTMTDGQTKQETGWGRKEKLTWLVRVWVKNDNKISVLGDKMKGEKSYMIS